MGAAARQIQADRLRSLKSTERLFPINAGTGWVGKVVRRTPDSIILKNPRPLHAAPAGWPDLCGFEAVTITADMVGQTIGVFVAEEIKAGRDRLSPRQQALREVIKQLGGVYRVITG